MLWVLIRSVLSGAMYINSLPSLSYHSLFVCVEVLRSSQWDHVAHGQWSMVSLPNHTFTGQA